MPVAELPKTLPTIASELGMSYGAVRHIVESRAIFPTARLGNYKVYDSDAIAVIRDEVQAIRRKQAKRGAK